MTPLSIFIGEILNSLLLFNFIICSSSTLNSVSRFFLKKNFLDLFFDKISTKSQFFLKLCCQISVLFFVYIIIFFSDPMAKRSISRFKDLDLS